MNPKCSISDTRVFEIQRAFEAVCIGCMDDWSKTPKPSIVGVWHIHKYQMVDLIHHAHNEIIRRTAKFNYRKVFASPCAYSLFRTVSEMVRDKVCIAAAYELECSELLKDGEYLVFDEETRGFVLGRIVE